VTGGSTASLLDVAVGVTLVGLGALGWWRRPQSRTGILVVATGAAWLLGDVVALATFLHRGPLVHAAVGYPAGRLRSTIARAVVLVSYVVAASFLAARYDVVSVAVGAAVLMVAARAFATAAGPVRRARRVGLVAATMVAAAMWVGPAARLSDAGSRVTALGAYDVLVLGSAALLVVDLLRGRWTDDTITGLMIDLGDTAGTAGLRDRLSRAIGDPTLTVGYWLAGEKRYVDEAGRPVDVGDTGVDSHRAAAGSGRVTTPVTVDGVPLAVLVHDRQVLADPGLLSDVAGAARFAVANAQLQAQVRARVAGVESSRRRLVTTADDERRRLEERLRDGAERHLDRVCTLLREARAPLAGLAPDAARARTTLHDLGLGLHPRSLTDGDLPTAVRELVDRSHLAVSLDVSEGRVPPGLATAAYFVCAEGLTNIAKYAGAAHVRVVVGLGGGLLELTVTDDGVGGADPATGSGLRGLADRAEALGGTLSVNSPAGGGTVLTLRLPMTIADESRSAVGASGREGDRAPQSERLAEVNG
jgi:hypothetical protein